MQQFFQALDIVGQRLGYRRGIVRFIGESIHALDNAGAFKGFAVVAFGNKNARGGSPLRTKWAKGLLTPQW